MNLCCENPTILGCLNSCDPLNLGVAGLTGDYTLILSSGYQTTQTFTALDELIFTVPLNENFEYTAVVNNPNATSSCFTFKTYYTVSQ